MSDMTSDLDLSLPFPIEFLILDTPRSHQSKNKKAKEAWKQKVARIAKAHIDKLKDWVVLDQRPLAATILYFPPDKMQGDVDNIVKLIVDGMIHIMYPDDDRLERVTVQKFEPSVAWTSRSLTPTMERAAAIEPPVIYVRIDDDLSWRDLA